MPYENSFSTIKYELFEKNSSSALQQSVNWIKFINRDWQYYSRGKVIFKKNPKVGLPKVSRVINSAISKRQGDQRKYFIKGKIESLWTPINITSLDGSCYESIDSSISQNTICDKNDSK